ncbi:Thyroid hormone receptor interactor 10 [Paragonimus heterotremus]|uniref:Thyroid hormone receptor interactor 10 n=1 Tax=Paragonimus heterotremus TaxID=100268 RepID=A0A8J4WUJ1_9TREM|nr:Thyroid hormone receptor interactor 10 [Paragonimus heterotremus]
MESGNWGVELWDQTENVLKQCSDQVSSTDSYCKLVSEVQKLQHEFGKKLRKTITLFQPKKKGDSDDLTYNTSFTNLVQSLSNFGTIFENGAKELGDSVVTNFRQMHDNEKKELENQRGSLIRLNQNLDSLRKQLDVTWQKYVLAYKERQKAHENWQKADKDMLLPRIEQQKAYELYHRKSRMFDQIKAQYAVELSKYNTGLRQHYNKSLVEFLEDLAMKDRVRTDQTKELLTKMNTIQANLASQLSDCVRQMQESVSTIDSAKDGNTVVKRNKTGELPPVDLPFLDLNSCPAVNFDGPVQALGAFMLGLGPSQSCGQLSGLSSGTSTAGSTAVSMLGGLRPRNKAKGEDLTNLRSPFICDLSLRGVKITDLTVIQLTERLKDLTDLVKRTESEIQGTQRLIDAYRNNPSLGSSKLVEPKEEFLKQRVASLSDLIKRLEDRYSKVGGDQALSDARSQAVKLQQDPNDICQEQNDKSASLDDFDSDASFNSEPEDSSIVPGVPASNTEPTDRKSPYVGYATAKYEYEGSGTTYLAAKPGELFYVVDLDKDNSGWTSVVSQDGSRKGFVPTGFIDVTMY